MVAQAFVGPLHDTAVWDYEGEVVLVQESVWVAHWMLRSLNLDCCVLEMKLDMLDPDDFVASMRVARMMVDVEAQQRLRNFYAQEF